LGVAKSLAASAGVGVPGIHDDRARKFFARVLRLIFTGAAQTWFVVNTPATAAGVSETIKRDHAFVLSRAFASAELFDVAENRGAFETAGRAN